MLEKAPELPAQASTSPLIRGPYELSPSSPVRVAYAKPAVPGPAGNADSQTWDGGELATAVYVTGSASMEPGKRYALKINGGRLQASGPLDVDSSFIAFDRPVLGMVATAIEGRLVISEPGSRSGFGIAFMSVAGTTPERLAATIVAAARAAAQAS